MSKGYNDFLFSGYIRNKNSGGDYGYEESEENLRICKGFKRRFFTYAIINVEKSCNKMTKSYILFARYRHNAICINILFGKVHLWGGRHEYYYVYDRIIDVLFKRRNFNRSEFFKVEIA